MTTVTVQNKFAEILASFGDVEESVNAAVQRYTIEQITNKITELRLKMWNFRRNTSWNIPLLLNVAVKMKSLSKPWKPISAKHGKQIYWNGNFPIRGLKIGRKNFKTFC